MTYTDIAVAAGIARTTLYRILRPDVRGVHIDTATALGAIDVRAWRERAASSRTTAPQRDEAITRAQRHRANVFAAGGDSVNGRANTGHETNERRAKNPRTAQRRVDWPSDRCRCDDCRTAMNADRAARKLRSGVASPDRPDRSAASLKNYCHYRRHKLDPSIVGTANRRSERWTPSCRWALLVVGDSVIRHRRARATHSSVDIEVDAGVYADQVPPRLPTGRAPSLRVVMPQASTCRRRTSADDDSLGRTP